MWNSVPSDLLSGRKSTRGVIRQNLKSVKICNFQICVLLPKQLFFILIIPGAYLLSFFWLLVLLQFIHCCHKTAVEDKSCKSHRCGCIEHLLEIRDLWVKRTLWCIRACTMPAARTHAKFLVSLFSASKYGVVRTETVFQPGKKKSLIVNHQELLEQISSIIIWREE